MRRLKEALKHKYALSEQGSKDMIKAFFAVTIYNLSLMLPVGLLYLLVTDYMSPQGVKARTLFYSVGVVIALLLIAVTTYLQYNATFLSTYKESGIRRTALAEKLRRLPLSFFSKKDLSDLTSTIMSDAERIETASSHWIPELVGAILSTLLVTLSLLIVDWRMALAALWVLPVAFMIVLASSGIQQKYGQKQNQLKLNCTEGIQECLESLKDLKSNNAQDAYLKGLTQKIRAVEKHAIVNELVTAIFVSSAQMILKLGIATVALVGSYLLMSDQLTLLSFFMFLLVVSRLYDPLQLALQNLAAIIALNVQTQRIDAILTHEEQKGSQSLNVDGYDISFEKVAFAYHQDEPVLESVSFEAKQGETTALIGPSGGGKTTVTRLAARFWDVDRGTIKVGGQDISQIDPETLMSLYAIVFQEVTLFNNSILENIRIGRKDASDAEVIEAGKRANCHIFVDQLDQGWHTLIGENGSELSGGERQRISIARAFLKDAPIILLDEATASLDVDNETVIQESLSRLIKNKTVLIIAHRMRTIADVDKIIVLNEGKVAEMGEPKVLKAKQGIYSHMYQLQTQSEQWKI